MTQSRLGVRNLGQPLGGSARFIRQGSAPTPRLAAIVDQRLVDEDSRRKADQDRRECHQPWPLRRIPDGRGRFSQKPFR